MEHGSTASLTRDEGRDEHPGSDARWLGGALVAVVVVGIGLRFWDLGTPARLFPDESYSAVAASGTWADTWSYVRSTDPHPPLFYFLLKPFAALSTSEAVLRVPSALCSAAALVLFGLWQRRLAIGGLVATAVYALSPTTIYFGHQVRMYGLLELVGVGAAFAAWRWIRRPTTALAVTAALCGTAAAFSHATGFIVLLGLLLVPGLRRGRDAIVWRAAQVVGLVLYAVVWGPALLTWRDSSLYTPLSLDSWTITVNELLAPVPDNRWLTLPLLALGGWVLVRRRDALGRVWSAVFLLPLAVATVLATRTSLFIPKSLVVISWGLPVAFGAVTTWAWRWRPVAGALVIAIALFIVVPVVPDTYDALAHQDEGVIQHLETVVADGDVVVANPEGTMVPWYFGIARASSSAPTLDVGVEIPYAVKVGTAPWTGRVWIVDTLIARKPLTVDGPPCAPPAEIGGRWLIRCLQLEPAS